MLDYKAISELVGLVDKFSTPPNVIHRCLEAGQPRRRRRRLEIRD